MPTGKMIGSKNCWFHDTGFRHPQGQLAVRIRATGRDDTLTEHRLRCGGRCVDDPTCKSAVAVAPRRRGKLLKTPTSTAIRSSRPRLPRVQGSDVAKPEGIKAPTGQFGNVAKYPPADFRLVSAPNADTLYSVAWLDLSEPQVLATPIWATATFSSRLSTCGCRTPSHRRASAPLAARPPETVRRSIANLHPAELPAISIPVALANQTADRFIDVDRLRCVINRRRRSRT